MKNIIIFQLNLNRSGQFNYGQAHSHNRLGSMPTKCIQKKEHSRIKNDAIKLWEQSSEYAFLYISHAFEDDHVH